MCAGIGNNTNNWVGHAIVLHGEKTPFRGKLVNSIRVSMPSKQPPKQQPIDDLDDGIPDFGDAA